ncbi:hypothetical protein VCH24_42890 [Variovorax boronicumulans]|nr:hypothetical protein VCH24_42890 [Variovorax boronicumulans]
MAPGGTVVPGVAKLLTLLSTTQEVAQPLRVATKNRAENARYIRVSGPAALKVPWVARQKV